MLHRLFASIIAGLAVVLTGVSAQTTEELPYGELKICAVPQRLVDYDSNQVSKWLNTMSMFLRCRHDSRFFLLTRFRSLNLHSTDFLAVPLHQHRRGSR
jgi:hypothetical protein